MECNPWQDLGLAVVTQAAEDYREVLKKLKRKPTNKTYQDEKRELDEFFNSEWCEILAGTDCTFIPKRLELEVQKDETERIPKSSLHAEQKNQCSLRSAYEAKRHCREDNDNT